jgi:hypothetical protein
VLDEACKPVTRWDARTLKKHPVTGESVVHPVFAAHPKGLTPERLAGQVLEFPALFKKLGDLRTEE